MALAYNNLGNMLCEQHQFAEAITHYHKAMEIKPDYLLASNMLFCANYHPDLSSEELYAYYCEYEAHFAKALYGEWRPHANDRDPQRRLKVGYVSPAFRNHSSRHFMQPLLAHHDHSQVEVYAYAQLIGVDEVTASYQGDANHWIPTNEMSDAALTERIRADGIDILVDVAGHTGDNRLLVFARKPAPVSLHWLDFGYTTGLTAIDYYLTDAPTVPPGAEAYFSEQPWRLPTPAYAYRPREGMGEEGPLPASSKGHITFGTLTRAVRLNYKLVRAWSALLNAVPDAHLIINSSNFKSPAMQDQLAERFMAYGIARERLEIGYSSPPWDVLRNIDIGLDCFPHNSGTTLFETLYMGIPFVTLANRPSVGCLGASILHGAGHPEWIAETEDEYIAKAVALAQDIPALVALRSQLRIQMQQSPLMDEVGFTRAVEQAYRQMWQQWCESKS
jgi:predicted O-linked N-acetylglucosamine transferase (SPINDLY family)